MTDVILTKQQVEPGKVDRLREWMAEVADREDEAAATLQNGGILTESAFLEHAEDGTYLVYYMEAENVERAFEAYSNSTHDIDQEHQEVMSEVLVDDDGSEYEPLYHLANPDR
jgi:L-rhamnose mutarotase